MWPTRREMVFVAAGAALYLGVLAVGLLASRGWAYAAGAVALPVASYLMYRYGEGDEPLEDRRRRLGQCVRCGYNLTGNRSGVCPECGTPCPGCAARKVTGRRSAPCSIPDRIVRRALSSEAPRVDAERRPRNMPVTPVRARAGARKLPAEEGQVGGRRSAHRRLHPSRMRRAGARPVIFTSGTRVRRTVAPMPPPRPLNLLTALSLLLCATGAALWADSYRATSRTEFVFRGARWEAASARGRFVLSNQPQRRAELRKWLADHEAMFAELSRLDQVVAADMAAPAPSDHDEAERLAALSRQHLRSTTGKPQNRAQNRPQITTDLIPFSTWQGNATCPA